VYDVFKKHRLAKLVGLALGLLLASYLIGAALALVNSRAVSIESMIGVYAFKTEHQIVINDGHSGQMVSDDLSTYFIFSYAEGTFHCASQTDKWTMKVVAYSNIYNDFDHTYLYRQEVSK
jgi:hypothetical protein